MHATKVALAEVDTRKTLEKRVLVPSKHPEEVPVDGDLVCMHYEARLQDGTLFDSSRARDKVFEFNIGRGNVIDAWEILIPTMALGERAELVVPPEFAYGEEGVPPIVPPNATLLFDVELTDIGKPIDEDDEETPADTVDAEVTTVEDDEEAFFWAKDPDREGGLAQGFTWSATGSGREICVTIPLDQDVKVKELHVDVRTFSMVCKVGPETVIDGELFGEVDMDDSYWDLDKKDTGLNLRVYLPKLSRDLRWESLLKGGDPERVKKSKGDAKDVEIVDVDQALNLANEQARKADTK